MDVRQFIIDGEQIDVKDVEARENIGDLSELETTAKDSLVSAINELENTPAGISDYNDLSNKPSINGVTLSGNKTTADLNINVGIESYNDLADKPSINNVSLVGDVDSSNLNIEYDNLTNRPVESGNVDMDSIVNPLPPIATEEKVLYDERETEYTIGWYINSAGKRKPVYMKSIFDTYTKASGDAWVNIAINTNNIEYINIISTQDMWSDNIIRYIPYIRSTEQFESVSINDSNTNVVLYMSSGVNNGTHEINALIEYTKSTDTWEDIPS